MAGLFRLTLKTAVEPRGDLQKPGRERFGEEGGISVVDLVGDSEKFYRQDLAKIRLGQLPFLGCIITHR